MITRGVGDSKYSNTLQQLPNTTCFPPNTRENFLLDVSKNMDTEAAQEPNLASKFSRLYYMLILQSFRSVPMRIASHAVVFRGVV